MDLKVRFVGVLLIVIAMMALGNLILIFFFHLFFGDLGCITDSC